MSVTPVAQLWAQYFATHDEEQRNRLVVQYSPLVKFVAGRIRSGLPSTADQSDLIADGVLGLTDAIERFEPDQGQQFETFALPRIRRAMIGGLRVDRAPRSERSKVQDTSAAQEASETRPGRAADDHEPAAEVRMSLAEVRDLYSELSSNVAGFEEWGAGSTHQHAGSALQASEEEEIRRLLRFAIGGLRERDQVILALYFLEQLTLASIGEVLGVTEARVSQLHTRAMLALREHLAAVELD